MTEQQNTATEQAGPQESGEEQDAGQEQAGGQHEGQPPEGQEEGRADDKELRSTLASERKQRIALQKQLDELQRKNMTDSERAIAEAREQGRTEALSEAARRIAAAEFRSAANGKLADPDAALELLDLGRLVGDDGEPDRAAIKTVIERLAPAAAQPKVPAGPRDSQPETDFIRARLAGRG